MRLNYTFLSLALMAVAMVSCNSGKQQETPKADTTTAAQVSVSDTQASQIAPMTRDMEFMIFLHRFTSDPDFQMEHVKFPLGKMSYAYLENQERYDSFTSKYWYLQSIESLRDHFSWKNDNKIVYLYNNSMIDAEEAPEFEETYTFEKIDGDWYVTKGDYSGSDVGLAEYTAKEVKDANAQYRKKYTHPALEYTYQGTPGDYPQASERLLTEEDLAGMSKNELRLMRNEIMARHGYSFKSADLKKHFESQLWFFPLFTNVTNNLSDIENSNVKFIQDHEK